MKNIILTLIILSGYFLQAQSPVKPLFLKGKTNQGTYYKDVDNDFDNFTGTWKYTNSTDTLIIKIEKREQVYINTFINYYQDMLVGEYRYVKNGEEKVNTISLLESPFITDFYDHNIKGASIIKSNTAPVCDECGENERRVRLSFSDPTRPGMKQGLSGTITLRRINEGGVQKIKMFLQQTGSYIPELGSNPPEEHYFFNLPFGHYTLTKVE